ncbi:MAG: Nif3-like dinuclear metal center hexameric protein [Egibacteraceae bacterium]
MAPADRLHDWSDLVAEAYPPRSAEAWDNVGVQVGAPDDQVTAVLLCLDVTPGTLDEAVRTGADLLLAHHPLFFRPLERLTSETAAGALALQAARRGIAVLAVHTNFDIVEHGTTAPVVAALDLRDLRPLAPRHTPAEPVKLVTFVPGDHTDDVLEALTGAGAGVIGEYTSCSFRVRGTGSFRPSADARPVLGERERLNTVQEDRLELRVPRRQVADVVAALRAAHPYEEVPFDLHPLVEVETLNEDIRGLGRFGELPQPRRVGELADRLVQALPSPHLRVAGDPERVVSRVAACGGAGDSLIGAALAAGAELYITGDLRHHVTLDGLTQGLSLIDAGHFATEAPALRELQERLQERARKRGLTARLLASELRTEPWSAAYTPPREKGSP